MLKYQGCSLLFVFVFKVCKVEGFGLVDYEEEIKKRIQMVYVLNWFLVDIKIGVSDKIF